MCFNLTPKISDSRSERSGLQKMSSDSDDMLFEEKRKENRDVTIIVSVIRNMRKTSI